MQETRWEIIKLLKKHHAMSAAELAAALQLSTMGIRQHLAILERDSLIEHIREKREKGRPPHLYKLTERTATVFPTGYEDFVLMLLDEVMKLDGEAKLHAIFKNCMHAHVASLTLQEKVKELTHIRNEEGYMAECVETEEGFVLREFHCPIASIARWYPYVCDCELELFKRVLGVAVTRECHLIKGDHFCSYNIPHPPEMV